MLAAELNSNLQWLRDQQSLIGRICGDCALWLSEFPADKGRLKRLTSRLRTLTQIAEKEPCRRKNLRGFFFGVPPWIVGRSSNSHPLTAQQDELVLDHVLALEP